MYRRGVGTSHLVSNSPRMIQLRQSNAQGSFSSFFNPNGSVGEVHDPDILQPHESMRRCESARGPGGLYGHPSHQSMVMGVNQAEYSGGNMQRRPSMVIRRQSRMMSQYPGMPPPSKPKFPTAAPPPDLRGGSSDGKGKGAAPAESFYGSRKQEGDEVEDLHPSDVSSVSVTSEEEDGSEDDTVNEDNNDNIEFPTLQMALDL